MTLDQRFRLLAAAERGLAWRRQRIMQARCTVWVLAKMLRQSADWHSLFECDRHGRHPLTATWTGPWDMETAIVDRDGA